MQGPVAHGRQAVTAFVQMDDWREPPMILCVPISRELWAGEVPQRRITE